MIVERKKHRWGILWRSDNRLDGRTRRLLYDPKYGLPVLFKTRKEAQTYVEERYGYIRHRKDLHEEPHGWKLPQPVKVNIYQRSRDGQDLDVFLEVVR